MVRAFSKNSNFQNANNAAMRTMLYWIECDVILFGIIRRKRRGKRPVIEMICMKYLYEEIICSKKKMTVVLFFWFSDSDL